MRQPCVEQAYQHHFSNSTDSLHASVSHYSNLGPSFKVFIITICFLVISNHFPGRRGKYVYAQFTILNQNPIILLMPRKSSKRSSSKIASRVSCFHLAPLFPLLSLCSTYPTELSACEGRNQVLSPQFQAQGMAPSSSSAKGMEGFLKMNMC